MSIGTKVGMATLSAGAIGGAGYGGYIYFSGDSFAKKLGVSVLKLTGKDDEAIWSKRLTELKAIKTSLPTDLEALKADGKTWSDLQAWCSKNSSKSFEKTTETNYENFEKFCTWKIGDKSWNKKIGAEIGEDDNKWKTAHTKLTQAQENNLSSELQKVKKKVANNGDKADQKAMHKWCTDAYKNTWRGNNDKEFKEVATYCQA